MISIVLVGKHPPAVCQEPYRLGPARLWPSVCQCQAFVVHGVCLVSRVESLGRATYALLLCILYEVSIVPVVFVLGFRRVPCSRIFYCYEVREPLSSPYGIALSTCVLYRILKQYCYNVWVAEPWSFNRGVTNLHGYMIVMIVHTL